MKFNRAGYDLAKSGSFIALEDKTKAGKNWVSAVAEIPLVRKPYSTELTPAVDSLAAAFPGSVVIEDDF